MKKTDVLKFIKDTYSLEFAPNDLLSWENDGTTVPKVFTATILLRPVMAETLKGRMHNNRNLKPLPLTRMVHYIKDAKWQLTHQGLAVCEDGTFVDGQHRVEAVIKTGVPVLIKITFGLTREAVRHLDLGTKRTETDAVRMDGVEYAGQIVPEFRIMMYAFGITGGLNVDDTVAVVKDLEQYVHRYTAAIQGHSAKNAAIGAALFLAQFGENKGRRYVDMLEGFFTGANLEVNNPLLAARRIALDPSVKGHSVTARADTLGRLLTAFRFWYENKHTAPTGTHVRSAAQTMNYFVKRMPDTLLLRVVWEEQNPKEETQDE